MPPPDWSPGSPCMCGTKQKRNRGRKEKKDKDRPKRARKSRGREILEGDVIRANSPEEFK